MVTRLPNYPDGAPSVYLFNLTLLSDPRQSPMQTIEKFSPPRPGEYHEYYAGYISRVDPTSFFKDFKSQPRQLQQLLGKISNAEAEKLHEPYTWTLKQVMGHIIDCERIFSTRLLRIAIGDEAPIPGIDQNEYVDQLDYGRVSMRSLLNEFKHLRKANVELVRRLSPASLENMGTASDTPVSARANLYILAGHVIYHMEIMAKRLGVELARPNK